MSGGLIRVVSILRSFSYCERDHSRLWGEGVQHPIPVTLVKHTVTDTAWSQEVRLEVGIFIREKLRTRLGVHEHKRLTHRHLYYPWYSSQGAACIEIEAIFPENDASGGLQRSQSPWAGGTIDDGIAGGNIEVSAIQTLEDVLGPGAESLICLARGGLFPHCSG